MRSDQGKGWSELYVFAILATYVTSSVSVGYMSESP